MAAKRYRNGDHRLFHRDAGYLEGRRVRKSREMRAMARRTDFGKQVIAGQWAAAEFDALGRLWELDLPVPYPVQLDESEMLMEFVGDTTGATPTAAPRLVSTRPEPDLLAELFEQLRTAMLTLAHHGWAHGDLSPYNVLLHEERLVLIDWPQVVDVIGNPRRVRVPRARRDDDGDVVRPQGARRRCRGARRRPRRRGDQPVLTAGTGRGGGARRTPAPDPAGVEVSPRRRVSGRGRARARHHSGG